MIDFLNVTKRFGTQTVLENASFRINPGEHVGIVGPNGAGKTTVFSLITQTQQTDKGDVIVSKQSRIGYVRQQLHAHTLTSTLLEHVESAAGDLIAIQAEIDKLEHEIHSADPQQRVTLLRRLGDLQTRFESMGGYTIRHRAERALGGLGFPEEAFGRPFRSFSGGWQSRAELARIIVAEPDMLLLDEPSNYLDTPTVEWLQRMLREFRGTLLLISHDRFLLNTLTDITIEIANGDTTRYAGNYDYYVTQREQRYEHRLAAQKNQDHKREQVERFIERFRAKNTKSAQVQSRIKQLEKMQEVELPKRIVSPGRIRLSAPPHCGAEVLRLEGAGLTYDNARWVLRAIDLRVMRGEKLALVGYNGLGKTTLLRMLAGKLPLSEGQRIVGHQVVIGYQSQDFAETMPPDQTAYATVKSAAPDVPDQQVRNLLGGFGFSGDAVDKHVAVLSGGEKIRLALARLLVKPPNVLVLDEPTTHLDIQAREALEQALHAFPGTILLVSHDIEFLRHVANGVVAMTPPGITRYLGGYDYYREKIANSADTAGSESKPAPSKAGAKHMATAAPDRKAARRERAEERQALHAKTREIKKTIQRAEQRIEKLEAERATLIAALAAPDAKKDFAELNRSLKNLEFEIARVTTEWEAAALELDQVSMEESPS